MVNAADNYPEQKRQMTPSQIAAFNVFVRRHVAPLPFKRVDSVTMERGRVVINVGHVSRARLIEVVVIGKRGKRDRFR